MLASPFSFIDYILQHKMLSKYYLQVFHQYKSIGILALISLFLLTSCSPHPGAGVWVAEGENELGFSKLIVAFEGKAEFKSSKPVEANWHCFWGKADDHSLNLDCSPSSNVDQARKFVIVSTGKMTAEFKENGKLIAKLKRVDENPVLAK